jgi:hypothetical protein
VPLSTSIGLPLPSHPLSFAFTSSNSSSSSWIVARITDHMLGKPSTAFQIVSQFSSSPTPTSPTIRLRLHPSFATLSVKMISSNPKMPAVPSNWRRDQKTLQRELDIWLNDVIRLDHRHPALISFLTDPNDQFTLQEIGTSSSGYFSFALGSMMEPKPYVSLFAPGPGASSPPKPINLLVGTMGSSKSSFISHVIGFPICDPIGSASNGIAPQAMQATFYEVLSPDEFAKMANFQSYWTHPHQLNLAAYPPGTESFAVEPIKLQEPIGQLETSWKRGGAFFLLDHLATLERYQLGHQSFYGTITCRTCIINEASLDPIRLEFEMARANIFVELNNFDKIVHLPSSSILPSQRSSIAESSSSQHFGDSSNSKNQVGIIRTNPQLMSRLLEVSLLRQHCSKLMYFVAFDSLHLAVEDCLLLEITELLCMNKDNFQFSSTLSTWVEQASTSSQIEAKDCLDLVKLLGLMKSWTNMLPTPRRSNSIMFLTTEQVPADALQSIAKDFQIHDILATTGQILLTRDSNVSTLAASKLTRSLSQTVVAMSTTSIPNPVYEHIIPNEERDLYFLSFCPRFQSTPLV